MSRWGASLRLKLAGMMAALAIVTVAAVITVGNAVRRRALRDDLDRKAHLYARQLQRQLGQAVAYDDQQTVRDVLNSVAVDVDVQRIALYADDGSLIEGSPDLPPAWAHHSSDRVESRWLPGMVEVVAPVVSPEGPRAELVMTLSTTRIEAAVKKTLRATLATGSTMSLVALVAAWLLAGVIARRLGKIAAAADRIAEGDWPSAALEPGAPDEIGRLTVGFNLMLERVRTEKERLAQLVESRTAELSASREQFRKIAETTRAIPFEFDFASMRFTYVGPQALGVLGFPVEDWFSPDFFPRQMGQAAYDAMLVDIAAQLKVGSGYDIEIPVRHKDGHMAYWRCSANVEGSYARGLVLDTTEKRELELELANAQRLESVGRLAAGVAHEINTPVQFANDSVTFVRDAWRDAMTLLDVYRERGVLADLEEELDLEYLREHVPRSADRASDGLTRIAEIVRSMKTFAQPEQTGVASYDVNQGIEATLIIAKNATRAVADVATQLGEVPPVRGTAADLNQVLLALITNAAQAFISRAGRGTITVTTREAAGRVVISISDDGCGIDDAAKPRIFDPFFTTRDVGGGRGQGLAMARAVVLRHGGDIHFESAVGVGTTFVVSLPAEPLRAAA